MRELDELRKGCLDGFASSDRAVPGGSGVERAGGDGFGGGFGGGGGFGTALRGAGLGLGEGGFGTSISSGSAEGAAPRASDSGSSSFTTTETGGGIGSVTDNTGALRIWVSKTLSPSLRRCSKSVT